MTKDMKSKAEELLEKSWVLKDKLYLTKIVNLLDAEKAVEIAEHELTEKAIEAHRKLCFLLEDDGCCSNGYRCGRCDTACSYMEKFINELNK